MIFEAKPATDPKPETVPAPVITLTGKELGDFLDTPEGRKALREAALKELEALRGKWLPCPALGGDIEVRKSGIKKVISLSGDRRKLQVVSKLPELLQSAQKISEKPNYDAKNTPNIKTYYTLRSIVSLDLENLAVRIVVSEDNHGRFYYDHSLHAEDVVMVTRQ